MEISKTCSKCKQTKLLEEFNKATKGKFGRQAVCRVCTVEYSRKYNEEHREEKNKKRIAWRNASEENKERDREKNREWIKKNPEKYKEIWKKSNRDYKIKVLDKVSNGNIFCANCGCDRFEFLEVNHINGGGAKEKKENGINNRKLYADILNGKRTLHDLNVLCKPCNNLHYLELKFGPQPYKITWKDQNE